MQVSDIMTRSFERVSRDLDVGMLPLKENGKIVGAISAEILEQVSQPGSHSTAH